jgi:hypothetical protein
MGQMGTGLGSFLATRNKPVPMEQVPWVLMGFAGIHKVITLQLQLLELTLLSLMSMGHGLMHVMCAGWVIHTGLARALGSYMHFGSLLSSMWVNACRAVQ